MITPVLDGDDLAFTRNVLRGFVIPGAVSSHSISADGLFFHDTTFNVDWELHWIGQFWNGRSNCYTVGGFCDWPACFARLSGTVVPASVFLSLIYELDERQPRIQMDFLIGDSPRLLLDIPLQSSPWYVFTP